MGVRFITLLVFIPIVALAGGSVGNCPDGGPEQFSELQKLSDSLSQILGPSALGDVPEFCRVNGFRDALPSRAVSLGKKEVGALTGDWTDGFIASEDQREATYKNANGGHDKLCPTCPSSIEEVQGATPLDAKMLAACNLEIDAIKKSPVQQGDQVQVGVFQGIYLCKDVTLIHAPGCAKSLSTLADLTKAHHDMNLLDVWQQVLSDPVYIKVMKDVTLRNDKLIRQRTVPESRLFDDLEQGFFAALHDREKAIDYTFNLLGVLASNGTNTAVFMPCREIIPNGYQKTLEMLGYGIAVLDRFTAQKGFLYSYPKEVNSLCDYGKNYHFWMTAFLARYTAKQSGDVTAAAAAAFTLNKGYQFAKVGGGRDPTAAFKENTFSNYNNNMRLDLSQAAAGAWFGATSVLTGPKSLSRDQFDTGLRKNFEGAQITDRDPNFVFPSSSNLPALLSVYSRWKATVNPDAAYDYYEQQLGQ